jgi:(2Fe-2S) ferredoxin
MGCSHVGGHKFAGNLIVYGPLGGHWYGRVKPCHAAAIVDTHIVQGRVIKELWRGRMDA